MGIRIRHLYTVSLALLTDSSNCSYGGRASSPALSGGSSAEPPGRGAGPMVSRFPKSWGAYWRDPVPPTQAVGT